MRILDIGCGINKASGAVGIDRNPRTQADLLWDLNRFPYPLRDSRFDLILCNHVVEHIEDLVAFMEEVHRVAQPGATVRIVTPHFTNRFSYADPTHRHHLTAISMDYFVDQPHPHRPSRWDRLWEINYPVPDFYSTIRFEKLSVRLSFGRILRWLGINRLANRYVNLYELYFAFLFPARDLYFELRVVK